MIDTDMIRDYLKTLDSIDRAELLVKELKQERDNMVQKIHSMLTTEGSGKVNVDGVTVAPYRKMRARAASMPNLIEALKAEGVDALVLETVNANTLSSWVNEFDPDRMCSEEELLQRLPPSIAPHITLYEQQLLSVTRS